MKIPILPGKLHKRSIRDTYFELLKSIALEESALSRIFNSEAEKIQAFVGKKLDFPTNPSTREIIEFNQTVNKTLDSLLMTEWLLLRKMDAIMQINVFELDKGKMEEESSFLSKDSFWESNEMENIYLNETDQLSNSEFGEKDSLDNIQISETDSIWDETQESSEVDPTVGDEDDFYW